MWSRRGFMSMEGTSPAQAAATAALDGGERRYRLVEFVALFFGLPAILAATPLKFPLLVMLFSALIVCTIMLWFDRSFDRRSLWNSAGAKAGFVGALALWVLGAVVLGSMVHWLTPERWLYLPRERTGLWLLICAVYPILSVYPQNVVYRAFVFQRYRGVFRGESAMVWASALAFCWAHVIFHNWVALALTLAGGLIFARTYQTSRSVLLVSIEHALYGLLVFTVGLGHTIYLGG
ncbi:hypothetical protein PHYC_03984 [Phycisphaerales bacterium]|nr:hypothetical protein PHYC_03984 [Phycisphaerales bacterium]